MRRLTDLIDVAFAGDVVIVLALCLSVAFFLVVMDYSLTRGELTRAQLALMRSSSPARHSIAHHVETTTTR